MAEGTDEAMIANGTTVEITSESPAVEVNGILSFGGPDGSAAIVDKTHLNSTAKEKGMGIPDEGGVTLEMNYLPKDPGQAALQAARTSKDKLDFKITLTDESPATDVTFSAYVTDFSIKGGVDDKVSASAKLEITGAVSW